ncbi:MAG: excinuclease ABC subunit C [Calditrichaeota bacterium]|nr:MAG: excinuclease ABC subunit C [Calditrichota bacterium]MBL1204084.1 excinuclease ABC subunit C [Calditrichota bacterium]NOG43915.1 excinuclease ABC subunit C [Calditrichota bacterium]
MTLTEKLANLPTKPGCYLFKDNDGKVLYVGKATILRNRVRSYFQKSRPHEPRLQALVNKISDVEIFVVDSEIEALILENNLIKDRKPRFNVNLKDDKSYPFIRITHEDFPQVFVTRKIIRDGSSYFGPYTDVKNLRYTLKTLQRIFFVRSCKYDLNPDVLRRGSVKLCLDFYINKCKGPCQLKFSKKEYNRVITKVRSFLKGKTDELVRDLKLEMEQQSANLEFEEAARTRDKLALLESYRNNQKMVQSDSRDRDVIVVKKEDNDACAVLVKVRDGKILGRVHKYLKQTEWFNEKELLNRFINDYYISTEDYPQDILVQYEIESLKVIEDFLSESSQRKVSFIFPQIGEKKKLIDLCLKNAGYLLQELKLQRLKAKDYVPHSVTALQRDLRLDKPPKRIECFDISNIQGTDPVASMVCFVDGKPKKSEYRKFNIRIKSTPDDFAMMREAVERRYSRLKKENLDFPDLIIVDGGKGQLSSAFAILKQLDKKDQPIIGLAKRLEEVFFSGVTEAQMLPKTSSSLRLIQQLRDEAHRFAVTAHRKRRSKRTLTSQLDGIQGIGENRRNALLKTFGSIKKIKETSLEDLVNIGKLPQKTAQNVFEFFNKPG